MSNTEMKKKLVLFNDIAPDVYALSTIYDPDVDGLLEEAKGKFVPAEESLVIDDTYKQKGIYEIWVVNKVDERLKTHLVRPQWTMTDDDSPNRIVSYGNDTYMLFYDIREGVTYLRPDNKLVFYGTRPAYYRLTRSAADGSTEIISRRVNANGNITGTAVPVVPIDLDQRDKSKVFSVPMYWSALMAAEKAMGTRDWEFSITFKIPSLIDMNLNESFRNSYVGPIHSNNTNGRFGFYHNALTNTFVGWIKNGTTNASSVKAVADVIGNECTVVFRKVAGKVQIDFNNVRQFSVNVAADHTTMWDASFDGTVPASYGNVNITDMILTDLTLEKEVWRAPYSSLWTSMGLTSPVVLKAEECQAVDDMIFTDGEIINMEVFEEIQDNVGDVITVQTMQIAMIARHSLTIQEMDHSSVPIVSFEVDLNGEPTPPEKWVLHRGQNPDTLSLTPKLVYEDGTVEYVPIDDLCCYVYGRDEVESNHVGMEYNLLFKYYPAKNRTLWENIRNRTADGFLTCQKTVKIIPETNFTLSKISVVPVWDNLTSKYKLLYFPYTSDHQPSERYADGQIAITLNSFIGDATKFGKNQTFVISAMITNSAGVTEEYTQTVTIQANRYTAYSSKEPWLISQNVGDALVYGNNSEPYHRPVIKYNPTEENYFIDGTVFDTVDNFLSNWYYAANPPAYTVIEGNLPTSKAPKPTHFVVKDLTTGLSITPAMKIFMMGTTQDGSEYIEVKLFTDPFNMVTTTSASEYVNKTVLVEFLYESDGVYQVLYGVPVEVRQ